MKVETTSLSGVLLIEPVLFSDQRGFFLESFNRRRFEQAVGAPVNFVQDSHSRSSLGVLRGLHYQSAPHAQAKLVRVTRGRVFDVAVDLRRSSPSFGRWIGTELSEENHRQLWVPAGCAHGFLVLSEQADFLYKTTDYYAPSAERSIRWDDSQIGIQWPLDAVGMPILSGKDMAAVPFSQAECFP